MEYQITEEDLQACWPSYRDYYLLQILNGEYSAESARDDLMSLIGSKFDPRVAAQLSKQTT